MRPVAMAFWDSFPRSLPIEFREAGVAAGEGFELGEYGERAREHVADGEGAVAGSDALEMLDPRTPAFRARLAALHRSEVAVREEKDSPGVPVDRLRSTPSSVDPRTASGTSRPSARRRRDNSPRWDSCGSSPGGTPPRGRT